MKDRLCDLSVLRGQAKAPASAASKDPFSELLQALMIGLRKRFPTMTFGVDIEHDRVIATGGDAIVVDQARAFCAGFFARSS
jgi:hypothetical protein